MAAAAPSLASPAAFGPSAGGGAARAHMSDAAEQKILSGGMN